MAERERGRRWRENETWWKTEERRKMEKGREEVERGEGEKSPKDLSTFGCRFTLPLHTQNK